MRLSFITAYQDGVYPGFCSMKRLGVSPPPSPPSLDVMLVHGMVTCKISRMIKIAGTQALFILGGERAALTLELCCPVLKKVIEKTVARDLFLFEVLFMKEKGRALVV